MAHATARRTPANRGLAPGRKLFDRYRVQRLLGRGGSAEVWLAHDDRLDRTVAIKAPMPSALPDVEARERFVAEARAAAGLSHPAIVPIYDVVQDPAGPAMVLRYVEGETLAQRVERDGPMAPQEAARIAADLAGALAHAHAAGLVHRDVKPGNVLVDGDGRVQLVDFGIAGSLGEAADARSGKEPPTEVTGTLRYMAPEQVRGAPVDSRSDLYALGLVLYELLTGRPAFEPTSPSALAEAQVAGPASLPARVPVTLRTLVSELLTVDPDQRPGSAAVVEQRLRAAPAGAPALDPPGLPPTISPGLPAASAGLAMLTDAGHLEATGGPALAAGPTATAATSDTARATEALPVAVTAPFAPVAAVPSVAAVPARAGATVGARTRPTHPAGTPPVAVLATGAAAFIFLGVVLAAGLGNLGSHPAAAAASGAAPSNGITAPAPTAPPTPAANGHHGNGHGHGGGDGQGDG